MLSFKKIETMLSFNQSLSFDTAIADRSVFNIGKRPLPSITTAREMMVLLEQRVYIDKVP